MRNVLITEECEQYIEANSKEVEKKFNYCLQILIEQKVVHKKLVKKLTNSKFYELRITTRNEHRIIIFSIDSENFVEANKVVLLNGFMKKNIKDYKAAIKTAEKLLVKYEIEKQ